MSVRAIAAATGVSKDTAHRALAAAVSNETGESETVEPEVIALTPEGYRVVEFNPIHSAGWYAANTARVLRAWFDWSCRNL